MQRSERRAFQTQNSDYKGQEEAGGSHSNWLLSITPAPRYSCPSVAPPPDCGLVVVMYPKECNTLIPHHPWVPLNQQQIENTVVPWYKRGRLVPDPHGYQKSVNTEACHTKWPSTVRLLYLRVLNSWIRRADCKELEHIFTEPLLCACPVLGGKKHTQW